MKRTIIFFTILIISLFNSAFAMCTYQNFAPDNGMLGMSVGTSIHDSSSNYNTHMQYTSHTQCWYGKPLKNVVLKIGSAFNNYTKKKTNINVTEHGYLLVDMNNYKVEIVFIGRKAYRKAYWKIVLESYNDQNSLIQTQTFSCEQTRGYPVYCYNN